MLQQSTKRWCPFGHTSEGHAWDWSFSVSTGSVAVRGLYRSGFETKQ
ncbi:hypothetical protein VCR4J2_550050 [Vibrio coralliirubri]|nr:hypothetical protein VCR4J2_550050 [Vibrio coralliirubri]